MATKSLYKIGLVCCVVAFIMMFIAFSSSYWFQSWSRVHSSFKNIGLWHVCFAGWIIPTDPVMKSYVGCWWIHSSEFALVANDIQPTWFRFIQAFSVFTLLLDLAALVLTVLYLLEGGRKKFFDRDTGRMFLIDSGLLISSAFLVLLISLTFARKGRDSSWMPRPWLNYLSWSFALCVVSGFFAAFGGMCLFVLGLIFKDKSQGELEQLDSAAELRVHGREVDLRGEKKRVEAFTESSLRSSNVPPTVFSPPQEIDYHAPSSVGAGPKKYIGESFV